MLPFSGNGESQNTSSKMAEQTAKNRKRKAAAITIAFHAVAILIFLFFGLKQPNPLPEESGASIEFGWDQAASGNTLADIQAEQPAQTQAQQTPAPAEPIEEQPEEDVATDDESQIAVPKEEEKPKPKPEKPAPKPVPKEEEKPKPQLDDKLKGALESLKNPTGGGGSKGREETGTGQQGNPAGGKTGGGSLGGGSGSWSLDGRSMLPGYGTKITTTTEDGIVVLNIWVNRNGEVTKVQPNLAESTTTSQYLINLAKNDVLNNFKWNASPNASIEQRGKVRYDFRLK